MINSRLSLKEKDELFDAYLSLALILGISVYLFQSMPSYRGTPIYTQKSSQIFSERKSDNKGLDLIVEDLKVNEKHEDGLASK